MVDCKRLTQTWAQYLERMRSEQPPLLLVTSLIVFRQHYTDDVTDLCHVKSVEISFHQG